MERYHLRNRPKQICEKCHQSFSNKSCFDSHCCSRNNKDTLEDIENSFCNIHNEYSDTKDVQYCENEIKKSLKTYGKAPVKPCVNKTEESNPLNHVCDICQKVFTTKEDISKHKIDEHGFFPFSCEFCHAGFSCKNLFVIHLRNHRKPFVCTLCNKHFVLKNNLDLHLRTHTGEKPFTCKNCQESFITKNLLINHMRVRHSRQDTHYACEKCPRTFKFKSHMLCHMHSHFKTKYFVCDVCSAEFKELSHLELHTCYTEQKSFVCDTCKIAFNTESEFNQHELSHEIILP